MYIGKSRIEGNGRIGTMKGEAMLDLRSCPRCKGDMHVESDMYGKYRQCWQCGFLVDVNQDLAAAKRAGGRELVGAGPAKRSRKVA